MLKSSPVCLGSLSRSCPRELGFASLDLEFVSGRECIIVRVTVFASEVWITCSLEDAVSKTARTSQQVFSFGIRV